MSNEKVRKALEKAIIGASKKLHKGEKGLTAVGLARLVSSYCRLQGIGKYGGGLLD